MTRHSEQVTREVVWGGLYIDFEGNERFEGNEDVPPSVLGVLDQEGFTQYIVEPGLYPMADYRPAAVTWPVLPADPKAVLESVLDRVSTENRRLFAFYAQREQEGFESLLPDEQDLLEQLRSVLEDAKPISKEWLKSRRGRDYKPPKPSKPWTRQGRWRLPVFLDEIGYHVDVGAGDTGKHARAIAQVRRKLRENKPCSRSEKKGWTNMLKHNFCDCDGLRAVLAAAAEWQAG